MNSKDSLIYSWDTFVALDLETTGLDAIRDEITELGAVKILNGEVIDTFSQLVNPKRSLSAFIVELTNITDEMLKDAPTIDEALPSFLDFIDDYPIIAHNAEFDYGFIKEKTSSRLGLNFNNLTWDTLELAHIILPRFHSYNLSTLLLGLTGEKLYNAHRALADAEAVSKIFLELIAHLFKKMDINQLQIIEQLTKNIDWKMKSLFKTLLYEYTNKILKTSIPANPLPDDFLTKSFNIEGSLPSKMPSRESIIPLDSEDIRDKFGPEGIFAQNLNNYEHRTQQIHMAEAVCQTYNKSKFLIVEAGTGTGKSLAYLLPSIYWSIQNNRRVIISTNTKNLQEQLFYKDIPLLQECIKTKFRAVLLKGRTNYICLHKWNSILKNAAFILTPNERVQLFPIINWIYETKTGDINENHGFNLANNRGLWSKLWADGRDCYGSRCPYKSQCFLNKIRKAALESHIVIVNHSLLFSDLSSDNSVLGDYQDLIFDEAHNIERIATEYLGFNLTYWDFRSLLHKLYQKEITKLGLLIIIQRKINSLKLKEKIADSFIYEIGKTIDLINEMHFIVDDFFRNLTQYLNSIRQASEKKIRYHSSDELLEIIVDSKLALFSGLERLRDCLKKLHQLLAEIMKQNTKEFDELDKLSSNLAARLDEISNLGDILLRLTEAKDEELVYWVELPWKKESVDTRLFAAPIKISEHLNKLLYDRLESIIFTSATMRVATNFDFLLGRLGLSLVVPKERVKTLALGSPFNYKKQIRILIPEFIPSPKSKNYSEAVINFLGQIIKKLDLGILVLFTSYGLLNKSYKEVKKGLASDKSRLLGQGLDGSRSNITERFRKHTNSVLFGTDSFWEGIDVPGKALECLVITKLPFVVPTEPIVQAHLEVLEKEGLNPFTNYMLPRAVIRFRQGFGRLIRSCSDRGIIFILDTRIVENAYGTIFKKSLPTNWHLCNSMIDVWEIIEKFDY